MYTIIILSYDSYHTILLSKCLQKLQSTKQVFIQVYDPQESVITLLHNKMFLRVLLQHL